MGQPVRRKMIYDDGGIKLTIGQSFQEYVKEKLFEYLKWSITYYETEEGQYTKGESEQGIEVKKDQKFRGTGNLFIETYEKRHADNEQWIPSGINRKDNSFLYLIGDKETLYLFCKKQLKGLQHRYIHKRTGTSKGFLLPIAEAKIWAIKRIEIK